jgi:tRNA-Thr(GGU) m(6)t(6)A37 methyltransferase TsaA
MARTLTLQLGDATCSRIARDGARESGYGRSYRARSFDDPLAYGRMANDDFRPKDEHWAFGLRPIGLVRSSLRSRGEAPRQGNEGAPDAWLELDASVAAGLDGIGVDDELVLLTWFHQSRRDVLTVHPRGDVTLPLSGVFATRSPDRPNPIGLHRVRVLAIEGSSLHVSPLEAIDGTPIVDIKPVLAVRDD